VITGSASGAGSHLPQPMPPFAGDPRILCTPADDDILFPHRPSVEATAAAVKLCEPCELRAACLAYGLRHSPHFGVFGGYTPTARRALLRRRNQPTQLEAAA
jgi:hypothetical protein